MRRLLVPAKSLCMLMLCVLAACGGGGSSGDAPGGGSGGDSSGDTGGSPGGGDTGGDSGGDTGGDSGSDSGLPVLHTFDATRAAKGEAMFKEQVISPNGLMSRAQLELLWYAWNPTKPLTGTAFWSEFRTRYGLHEAPFDNGGLPLGVREKNGSISFDCLLCHAGKVAGQVVLGVANSTLDLQGLHDDVALMANAAGMPAPYKLTDKTGAAGATDAFGLAMELTKIPGIETHFGYQRPTAWWTIKHKDHLYSDGSGSVSGTGYRPMMATLFAFGATLSGMKAMEGEFEDIFHYLLSLEAPAWPKSINTEAAVRGKVVYGNTCAGCHGDGDGFPEKFISVSSIGTDPLRAQRFTATDAAVINASWFGETPMVARGAYMAPPLVGIWARAPYFHNGSVPTLKAVLDPSVRPQRWQRTGSGIGDFDFVNVGWRYTEPAMGGDRSTIAGRRIYDTSLSGLSAQGHTYGAPLTAAQRDDLIEYLKTL